MTIEQFLELLDGVKQSGKGWKAFCPAHEDRNASLSVAEGTNGHILLKCFAGCSTETIVAARGLTMSDLFNESPGQPRRTPKKRKKPAGKPPDWPKCVAAFTDDWASRIAKWRGLPPEFFLELKAQEKIGVYDGLVCFPIESNGKIIGVHCRCRGNDNIWFYKPDGLTTTPMIFGELVAGDPVYHFESTWDALAFMAVTGERNGIVCTRGASNGKFAAVIPEGCPVYAWKQNDEVNPKTGKRAGDVWLEDSCEHVHQSCTVKAPEIPVHDFNDWTKGGATSGDVLTAIMNAETVRAPYSVDVDEQDSPQVEPPTPYKPPPLTLLSTKFQEYIHAAAESLKVDVAYILLPLLSAIASAIGNSRSILLKFGYIEPPVIWTGIIGNVSSRKSPSVQLGCFAVSLHERELVRQNIEAKEIFAEKLAKWEATKKELRGDKPEPPAIATCKMDDLTLEVLAHRLEQNPRGVLVAKDELSHWLASFDQYRDSKGSDVSRWVSIHTGVEFGIDRRTDNRHTRIWLPRVPITGGIQPKVLRRVLTEDYFERGLPARFLFAYPPFHKARWSEVIIPDDLIKAVRELFDDLWLLQPDHDDQGQPTPVLLRPDRDAKAEFIRYYNDCGDWAAESNEREEAAWGKLSGYAARLALVGQLVRGPASEIITIETMQAACELSQWFGVEATRIYATLAETPVQREQRKLIEFIESRGGAVTVRDVMQGYWPLRNQREEIEFRFRQLEKAGRGKWEEIRPAGRGRPTRAFQLLSTPTSTQITDLPRQPVNSVDVEDCNIPEITSH